jgi:hypothetical protein
VWHVVDVFIATMCLSDEGQLQLVKRVILVRWGRLLAMKTYIVQGSGSAHNPGVLVDRYSGKMGRPYELVVDVSIQTRGWFSLFS